MVYLYIDESQIKLFSLNKTILNQYGTSFFSKKYDSRLTESGKIINTDLLASAIKESLTHGEKIHNQKEITLILPQKAFHFFRTTVPSDIAPSAITSFIKDKARSELQLILEDCSYDYFVMTSSNEKIITFYAIDKKIIENYNQVFSLIDIKIKDVLPDTLTYFKLFDKTLRKEKREVILFVNYEEKILSAYLFDSYGLLDNKIWKNTLDSSHGVESVLKNKVQEFEKNGIKLNRIILSGNKSDSIRQDTFTKAVGVWTNPLKRIIPNFYQDYLKQLIVNQNQTLPILNFDCCFGGFIFNQENKNFSLNKKNSFAIPRSNINFRFSKITLPIKEILLFSCSFILSFVVFIFLFNIKPSVNFSNLVVKPSLTPKPVKPTLSPTPTITIDKEKIKIKVLNGSGTAGKANQLKDILKEKGYLEILTGNADNFDYLISVIKIKKNKSDLLIVLKNDLKEYLPSIESSALEDDNTADIILIIGADFK